MAPDGGAHPRPSSIDDVLAFAMDKEIAAVERYLALAERVEDPAVTRALEAIADQERAHHDRLAAISAGDLTAFNINLLEASPVSESTPVAEPGRDASLAQVLLYAIDAEHEAFQLYMGLAGATDDPGLAMLLRTLANEELAHRTRLDRLYREVAFG